MPSSIAVVLTVLGIAALLVRDARAFGSVSAALWIPVLWLLVVATRNVSQWLDLGAGGFVDAATTHGGSPIDAGFFLAMLLAGLFVLSRRRLEIAALVRNNRWLVLFVAYGFIAILWSDFPVIALKRWIKALGHPVMALVILTDPQPRMAIATVLRRCGYVVVLMSILFIKYLPEFGRQYDPWTGAAFNSGVAQSKNQLGIDCTLFGLYYYWNLLTARRYPTRALRAQETVFSVALLAATIWLLYTAQSATSIGTFAIGATVMTVLGPAAIRRRLIAMTVSAVLLGVLAQAMFDIYSIGLETLGRDASLTDRTELWADALALVSDPIFGAGFESFWLGERVEILWEKWWWRPIQAHNGYIETYLNLGAIGVAILLGTISSAFIKASRQARREPDVARLRLALLAVVLFYNYTEAAFVGVHVMWTVFYLVALDYPRRQAVRG